MTSLNEEQFASNWSEKQLASSLNGELFRASEDKKLFTSRRSEELLELSQNETMFLSNSTVNEERFVSFATFHPRLGNQVCFPKTSEGEKANRPVVYHMIYTTDLVLLDDSTCFRLWSCKAPQSYSIYSYK